LRNNRAASSNEVIDPFRIGRLRISFSQIRNGNADLAIDVVAAFPTASYPQAAMLIAARGQPMML
jgi:hypothetical protein